MTQTQTHRRTDIHKRRRWHTADADKLQTLTLCRRWQTADADTDTNANTDTLYISLYIGQKRLIPCLVKSFCTDVCLHEF